MKRLIILMVIAVVLFTSCLTISPYKDYLEIPFAELEIGRIVTVNDPAISKYAFIYYIPESALNGELVKTVLIGNGLPHAPYQEVINMVEGNFNRRYKKYSDEYGYALLTVVTPGLAQYLDRTSMISEDTDKRFWYRPDLEYRKVIKVFTDSIESIGYDAHGKVYMTGFSCGGMQANIFSVLHPDMVEATAVGAGGSYLYPVEKLNGIKLEWPVGFADIRKIKNITFTPELFKQVESRIFVGEDDINNDPMFQPKWKSYRENFGVTTVDRVPIYTDFLVEYGVDAEYEIYENIGHEFTSLMLDDLFEFFDSVPVQ